MRLGVLGCTGGTGKEVVRQALERGWEVVALARSPEKLNEFTDNRLKVVKADVFSAAELGEHLAGVEAVVSCLGVSGVFFPWSTVTITQDAIKPLLEAMKAADVKRVVTMSSWCTVYQPGNPFLLEWVMRPLLLRQPLADHAAMEDILELTEDSVHYTIVKPPGLTYGQDDNSVIRTSALEHVPGGSRMPRAAVARFILQVLDQGACLRQKVAIAL